MMYFEVSIIFRILAKININYIVCKAIPQSATFVTSIN